MGAAGNVECQIDAVAQSLSCCQERDPARSRTAMESVDRPCAAGACADPLLDPPFDKSETESRVYQRLSPRSAGKRRPVSHAAIWTAMAFAVIGDSRRAWELTAMITPGQPCAIARGRRHLQSGPYVVAADVYALAPHTGRGGWSWYTGWLADVSRRIVEIAARAYAGRGEIVLCPVSSRMGRVHGALSFSRNGVPHRSLAERAGDVEAGVTVDGVEQHTRPFPWSRP